jgi:hypothetical protein
VLRSGFDTNLSKIRLAEYFLPDLSEIRCISGLMRGWQ